MSIATYRPQISIFITRTVHRPTELEKPENMDIVPFLTKDSEITISKSLYSPIGSVSITIPDQPWSPIQDSLYGLVEPMDAFEIRMARNPHEHPELLPIVMRGFIKSVDRYESIDAERRPHRRVTILGYDYGTIFNQLQVNYLKGYVVSENILSTFRAYIQYGINYTPMVAGEFMTNIVEGIIQPYLDTIGAISGDGSENPNIPTIGTDISVTEGTVTPFGISAFEGPIWRLMVREADTHVNELYVEDFEDKPKLVYRPTPFKDLEGEYIKQGDQAIVAVHVSLDSTDIVSISVSRDDHDVANFIWAEIPSTLYFSNTKLIVDSLNTSDPTVYDQDYQNNDPNLYGLRKMQIQLRHGPTGFGTQAGSLPEHLQRPADTDVLEWAKYRRSIVRDLNRDNVLFEKGTLIVKGNETLKPGRYIILTRGVLEAEYYITSVKHMFQPYGTFVTTCNIIRGTGFINRDKLPTNPYWHELAGGPYENEY